MKYGYARVSNEDENPALQLVTLNAPDVRKFLSSKMKALR